MAAQHSPQVSGWQARGADTLSPSRQRRQAHAMALLLAVSLLGATAVLHLIDDPRPLDVQLSDALGRAGLALKDWQLQLSRGLQVSLLTVADASELPEPTALASPDRAASAATTQTALPH